MPNLNRLWADLLVEELVRCGVERFCVAPGSRSTPLVTAVAAHPHAQPVVHYDERGTAFYALGYGRATRRPAAWITTSGTALANGFPAIVEAATDGVPMLLLTADRPPELRQTGANQTIDQVKLFGQHVRWFFDLPPPTTDLDPAMLLTTVDQAVYRARRAPAGPVHLNLMFREPLAPTPDGNSYSRYLSGLEDWHVSEAPFTCYAAAPPLPSEEAIESLAALLGATERGLIVAGRLPTPEAGRAAQDLARRLGWPLLPDIGSHVRLGKENASEERVGFYDMVLASEAFREAHTPEAVLHLGGRPTSKRLARWLAAVRPQPYAVVLDVPARLDPFHHVTHRVEGDVAAVCEALAARLDPAPAETSWLHAWRAASARAAAVIGAYVDGEEGLTEPQVAWLTTHYLPEDHALVLSSSMPVRDADSYGALDGGTPFLAANRGASGIDGLVATAAGVCDGRGGPTTLLIGDLALLHDLNSLMLLRERPVVVVVLNNDGGGIFSFLPIAEHDEVFEPFFGTPHGRTFEAAADLFGLPYHRPEDPDAFVAVFQEAAARSSGTIIEVTTDRAANHALHQALLARVAEAVA